MAAAAPTPTAVAASADGGDDASIATFSAKKSARTRCCSASARASARAASSSLARSDWRRRANCVDRAERSAALPVNPAESTSCSADDVNRRRRRAQCCATANSSSSLLNSSAHWSNEKLDVSGSMALTCRFRKRTGAAGAPAEVVAARSLGCLCLAWLRPFAGHVACRKRNCRTRPPKGTARGVTQRLTLSQKPQRKYLPWQIGRAPRTAAGSLRAYSFQR